MKRKLLASLVKWKNDPSRKPLILEGARQVGKTHLLKEIFGASHFKNVIHVDFNNLDTDVAELFSGTIDPLRIVDFLAVKYATTIRPNDTLLIFDEIQENQRALDSLKYFNELAPEYCVAASGSLLGLALGGFPVGKVDHLRLEPMDFEEFLWALGKEEKTQYLRENLEDAQAFNDEFKDDLYQHLAIGGMPEAVGEWAQSRDFGKVEQILSALVSEYNKDFGKHTDSATAERIRSVWQSIPSQFAKENHKFIYGAIADGARGREYESAIQWLVDAGLVRKINLTSAGDKIPLMAYQDIKSFKLYLLDIGLLRKLSNLPPDAIIGNEDLFRQWGGVFAEQFVLQQIQSGARGNDIFYWTGVATDENNEIVRKNHSEVDFLTTIGANIVPIEVKSGENVKSKSLRVFRDRYSPKLAVRFSLLPQLYSEGLLNIPLYRAWVFDDLAARQLEETLGQKHTPPTPVNPKLKLEHPKNKSGVTRRELPTILQNTVGLNP